MLDLRKYILMNEAPVPEASGSGGSGYVPTETSQTEPATVEAQGNATDEFGYEVPATEGVPKEEGKPASQSEQKTEPTVEKPVSGYLDEKGNPKEKIEAEAPPEETAPTEDKVIEEGDEYVKGLKFEGVLESDKDTLSKFIKEHKIEKKTAQALLDLRKAGLENDKKKQAAYEKQVKDLKVQIQNSWVQGLKEDKEYGGANFAYSVKQSERVLNEFLSNTKNELTKRGDMVPPYLMKDLLGLAKRLYAKESFDNSGNGAIPDKDESANNPYAHLEFYS